MLTAHAHSGSGSSGARVRHARAPVLARGRVGDLRGLLSVVALVRHEVLQDHLLDVPVLGVQRRERLQRLDALLLALADAHEDPARERDPQLARRADRLQAPRRVLASASPRARSPSAARRSTRASAPARRSPRAGARGPRGRARRGWCAAAGPARARVRTSTPRSAVKSSWPYSRSRSATSGLTSGRSPVSTSSSLTCRGRPVEDRQDLLRRMQVRRVGGERAVLAVAATRPRQRQRQVAREGDPAAHCPECMRSVRPIRRAAQPRARPRPGRVSVRSGS